MLSETLSVEVISELRFALCQYYVVTRPVPTRAAAFLGTRTVLGFMLAMISAALILLNAVALISPGFFGPPTNWSLIFFWLSGLSGTGQSIAVLIGLIDGFIVMAGGIMMILRRAVFGGMLVIPFAAISFIIGGGFIVGAVLGIVAGLLGAFLR